MTPIEAERTDGGFVARAGSQFLDARGWDVFLWRNGRPIGLLTSGMRGGGRHMGDVKYRSEVRIEQREGLDREAFLPPLGQPAMFGVHGPVALHYGVDPDASRHPTTLDYVVGATAGCLLGTLGVVLAVRGIDATEDRLTAVAVGEVEDDDGVLVIKRIHVRYRLAVSKEQYATAERVHEIHASHCAVARSIASSIAVTTELETVAPQIDVVPTTR